MKTKFHEQLTRFRNLRGLTQAQMSEKLGISRSTYANYESGNRSPDFETLENISDVLNCTLDELFGRYPRRADCMAGAVCEEKALYRISGTDSDTGRKKSERKLVIGAQDFRFLREKHGYYVDKTQMIEQFLNSWYQVTLITRPRRFGKTLNMSMLAEFLDCTKKSEELFEGTKISRTDWMREINQYPVVFISFLNAKADSADGMIEQLAAALRDEYERYLPVVREAELTAEMRNRFQKNYECLCMRGNTEERRLAIQYAVSELCSVLEVRYSKKTVLLLDEYDTPFISANSGGYYNEVRGVLSGILSSSLKGNRSLERALLTGIQRVAKENIFSGLNNLVVCTVKDPEYADCFGFTENEVKDLLRECGAEFTDEVKRMYDGYRFGGEEVYNPWSISCYAARKKLEAYWVNTGENSLIKNALAQQSGSFRSAYNDLIRNGTATVYAELSSAYYEKPDDASLWGMLINAGMVAIQEQLSENLCVICVPNQEVWKVFQELTAFYLRVEEGDISRMLCFLQAEQIGKFAEEYRKMLMKLPSFHDLKDENSYHMMMLGMYAFMQKDYEVRSNRESGRGRGDLLLYAKKPEYPNMILEFKYTKDMSAALEDLAEDAVAQIKERKYDAEMTGPVLYIGLAHRGKDAEVRWEKRMA